MERHEQRFVLGPDGTEDDTSSVRRSPGSDVLAGIGANGEPRQVGFVDILARARSRARRGRDPLGRGEQRIDIDLLDPRLLDDQLAEPHQELLKRGQVDRRPAADALRARCRSWFAPSAGGRGSY